MDAFEISVAGELFRVNERTQPNGQMSYDFGWLNGPADGTYGFTLAFVVARHGEYDAGERPPSHVVPDVRLQLTEAAREFIEGFYAPGGIGEEDFPDHVPANRD